MTSRLLALMGIPAMLICAAAHGQAKPIYNDQSITVLQSMAFGPLRSEATPVDDAHGLPIRCMSGCSGGASEGTPTGAAGTPNAKVVTIQGTAGATAISVSAGSLPLPNGAATGAKQDALLAALGTPLQAGGAVNPITLAATSTALTGTVTTGTTAIGPFTPQLGRGIRVILRGTWAGTFAVSTSVDACATNSPLTIGGSTWGSFTGNANEIVDIPTLAGVVYCATATVSSGSLLWGLRQ